MRQNYCSFLLPPIKGSHQSDSIQASYDGLLPIALSYDWQSHLTHQAPKDNKDVRLLVAQILTDKAPKGSLATYQWVGFKAWIPSQGQPPTPTTEVIGSDRLGHLTGREILSTKSYQTYCKISPFLLKLSKISAFVSDSIGLLSHSIVWDGEKPKKKQFF